MIRFLAALLVPLSALAAPAVIEPWPLPVGTAAAQPSLSRSADGALNLSWIERSGSGHRLKFARYAKARWSETRTIAEGDNWFVNWADFPSTTQLPDGTLWAHNLVKSAKGTYDYDVVLYRSGDGQFIFRPWPQACESVFGLGAVVIDADRCRPGFAAIA